MEGYSTDDWEKRSGCHAAMPAITYYAEGVMGEEAGGGGKGALNSEAV